LRIACVNQDPGIAPGRKKGAAVHVAAMREAFRELGASVLEVDTPDPREVELLLAESADGPGLDLIYERYALSGYAASAVARRHGIPHVLEVNAPLAQEARVHRPEIDVAVDSETERRQFHDATVVLAVSHAVAQYAFERGADPSRVTVAPNGVDTDLFRPRSASDATRSALVPEGRFALGFHGRLRPWHNFELLVEITRDLLDLGEPVFLLTVGEGSFLETVRHALPEDCYRCIDWVEHAEIGSTVAAFDALVLTHEASTSDGSLPFYFSPLKLHEAMAAGVVPVVPDLGDLPSLVEDGRRGLVYSAGDRTALVRAIRRLIVDHDLRRRLAGQAREHAETHTWTSIARHVLESATGWTP
jgi:starch synthase